MDLNGTLNLENDLTVKSDLGIASGGKIYLDGIALTGDTYIYESAANTINFFAGASSRLTINTTASAFTTDLSVAATKKIYLDGGGDTYITESLANLMKFYCGATQVLELQAGQAYVQGDFVLDATERLYLDGGGDSYLYESSSNTFNFVAGASTRFTLNTTTANFSTVDVNIPATKKLYLDGGGDTYIYEEAANDISIYCGASNAFRVSATRAYPRADVWLDATKKLYFDGGSDTYWHEAGANVMELVVGGASTIVARNDGSAGVLLPSNTTPTANYATRQSICKGWITHTDTGTSNDSHNVTSITKNSAGHFTIVWATDFSTANYCAAVTPENIGCMGGVYLGTPKTAAQMDIVYEQDSGIAADVGGHAIAFGNQ